MFLIPAGYYSVFAAFLIEEAKFNELLAQGNIKQSSSYNDKANKLFASFGYLAVACNLISCVVMILVLRLVRKVTASGLYRTKQGRN